MSGLPYRVLCELEFELIFIPYDSASRCKRIESGSVLLEVEVGAVLPAATKLGTEKNSFPKI